MPKLTKRTVDTIKEPGFYGDGDGLYLSVKPSGSKSWILRTVVQGKRRDIGLGSTGIVSLSEVRETAREMRKIARSGGDPCLRASTAELTFEEAAKEYHDIIAPTFTSPKHAKLWLSGLKTHAFPHIGDRELTSITVTDVRKVLEPVWNTKHETARKLKQRIGAIFDWAKAEGHYEQENPCTGIKRVLKPQRRNPVHHAAMPWRELPEFYLALTQRDGVSASALRFIILTACRSREVREAQWSEIVGDLWTVPEDRAKARKEHRVPLSAEAIQLLEKTRGLDKKYIFPSGVYSGTKNSRPLSVNAFRSLYERMGWGNFTTHGFRSSFRDWCSEYASAQREVAEAALAHSLGQVERAYRRTDLLEQRSILMAEWAAFLTKCGNTVHKKQVQVDRFD